MAVLPDGRVVTGGDDGQVLVWDPAARRADPVKLGGDYGPVKHDGPVYAVAVLPGGRVVTGGYDKRLLVWNPADPDAAPAELGRHDGPVYGVAALPGGRVVSGGYDKRVLVWDPARNPALVIQLNCSVTTLATAPHAPAGSNLAIVHERSGFSFWSLTE